MGISYGKIPKEYQFNVNGYGFKIILQPWNDENTHPRDILIHDLQECIQELASAEVVKPFSLPPLNPDDNNRNKG